MSKNLIIFLVFLTIFSLLLRLYRLTEPKGYYFDEVYHAVTAKAYADNVKDAYNPFSSSPKEGTAYDWLHPPLAKLIQAASIKILGDRPLGWRLPSVIFGTLIIPTTFILTNLLFGPTAAIFASTVLAFENLTFVMSRITMNDIFVDVWILIGFIFSILFVKNQKTKFLALTSIFLGLAVATKWSALYAIFAVAIYIFLNQLKNSKFDLRLVLLVAVPAIIYLTSYSQFWLQGYSVGDFINLHKQIWWYQNRGDLVHSYGTTALYCAPEGLDGPKTFCPWVLNVRGVYFSYEQYGSRAGYIYALGNPLIFWAGIIAVSYLIGKFLQVRKWSMGLVLLGYFVFWLPWIFAPRILFLYHYLPSIPFMAIALGVTLSDIWRTKLKLLAVLAVLIFAITFFYFLPITAGYPIEPSAIDKYMWLKTWR